jgi:hypothetical protein
MRLTREQREELNQRARAHTVAPRRRERLEMVRLSDLGQTIPQIAHTLGHHEQTVRQDLKAFLSKGFAALPDRPISGRPPTVTRADVDALGWGTCSMRRRRGARPGRRPACGTG